MKKHLFCVSKIVLLFSIVLIMSGMASCKQNGHKGGNPPSNTNEVSLTVLHDEFVTKIQNKTINVTKDVAISLSDLKSKIGTIEVASGYEVMKICVGNSAYGDMITDVVKHQFSGNANIFIASQKKSSTPIITSLKIGGKSLPIQDDIDAGYTQENKVDVQITVSPADSTVTFKTAKGASLDEKNYWALSDGENNAVITVKKGSVEKAYKLKIVLGEEPMTMGLNFFIDKKPYASNQHISCMAEQVELLVQTEKDVMSKVEIGEEGSLKEAEIQEKQNKGQKKFWQASLSVKLTLKQEKKFIIKVTPKNQEGDKYKVEECVFFITGEEIPDDNAEFQREGEDHPKKRVRIKEVKWKAGCESNFPEDYGVEGVIIEAFTVSSKANVKYKFIDPYTSTILDSSEYSFTNNHDTSHTSPLIPVDASKPSAIKVFVVAENGVATNPTWGTEELRFNPIELKFGYEYRKEDTVDSNGKKLPKTQPTDYKFKAWDEVKIDKDKVKQDNKVFLCLYMWKDASISKVEVEGSNQKPEITEVKLRTKTGDELRPDEVDKRYWSFPIDVEELIKTGATITELNVAMTIKQRDKEVFTYKVKIGFKSNNAQFEVDGTPPKPRLIFSPVKWKDEQVGVSVEDYGLEEVKARAFTVDKKASVNWQLLNPVDDSPIQLKSGWFESNGDKSHISDPIELEKDKPSKIRFYVRAEDGGEDATNGRMDIMFNPIYLTFGYDYQDGSTQGDYYKEKAWDVINIEKAKVTQDNTVFLCFAINNNSTVGEAKVKGESESDTQTITAKKLGAADIKQDYWLVPVNVEKLIKDGATIKKLDASITLNKGAKSVFTYDIIIKVKE